MNKFRSIDTVTFIIGVSLPILVVMKFLNWWVSDTLVFKQQMQSSTHGYSTMELFNVDYDIYFYDNSKKPGVLECLVVNNAGNTQECTVSIESNGVQISSPIEIKVGDYIYEMQYSGAIGEDNYLIYNVNNKGNTSRIKCPIIIERR